MLPSRMFRNVGIPPLMRSLIVPHPSLPSLMSVQLRMRPGVLSETLGYISPEVCRRTGVAPFSTSTRSNSDAPADVPAAVLTSSEPLSSVNEPKLQITFTCTASDCNRTRSTHTFTKRSYEKGIVLIQCPGCKNRHLIADHLGWFKESTENGNLATIEDILRARGETITKGTLPLTLKPNQVVEYAPEE